MKLLCSILLKFSQKEISLQFYTVMKKIFLIILFVFLSKVSFGQRYEMGVLVGGSNVIGDVGQDYFIYPNSLAGGVLFKYNLNPRIALRANLMHLGLEGDDRQSNNYFRRERGRSFSNGVSEFAIGTEFNFLKFTLTSRVTPYILTQVAVFQYKSPISYNERSQKPKTKKEISYTLPVGLGVKARLSDELIIGLEGVVRFTLKDDLDYTSQKIKGLDFGVRGYDHYMFVGLSLVYTFGRPPCYVDLK